MKLHESYYSDITGMGLDAVYDKAEELLHYEIKHGCLKKLNIKPEWDHWVTFAGKENGVNRWKIELYGEVGG
jgi:hypothetical protein